jgi:RNA recognition motif-containing protein
MRGCPYKVEAKEIVDFFDGFGALTVDDIFIEESNGRRTGSALVVFENKEIAQDAKAALNKKNIGEEQRYVELHDCNDMFMKKVCQLFDDQDTPQNNSAGATPYEEEKE